VLFAIIPATNLILQPERKLTHAEQEATCLLAAKTAGSQENTAPLALNVTEQNAQG
jgi:hypothetical protein